MTGVGTPFLAGIFTGGAFGYLFDYFVWWVLFLSLILHTWCFFRCFPRKRLRRIGLVLGNGLVFLCLLGSVAMVAESYLRFVAVYTDSFGVSLPARRWFALHTSLNSMGCRDHEWSIEKPAGVRRIAFVGDSYTYGWGIERVADRFTDLIQARFDEQEPGAVEVMNVAKPGWSTADEIRPIHDMITVYGADEIVLCYVPNDIEDLIPTTASFNPTRPPDYQFINLDSSPLLDYLYRRLYLPLVPTVRGYHDWLAEGYADDGIWQAHLDQLNGLVTFCRTHDVSLRVVLLPFLVTSGKKFDGGWIRARLRRMFEASKVPVIDLGPLMADRGVNPRSFVVNALDAHPNEAAHALFARAVWAAFYAR